jgi:hypothetical protein
MDPAVAQVAGEHASSDYWTGRVDRLRELARGEDRGGYTNSTGPLDERTWEELLVLAEEGRRPASVRPRGHKGRATETDEGNRHVRSYLAGCRKYARSLGNVELAKRVHGLVCGEGYLVDVSGYGADRPWQLGYRGSAMAAHIHRRSDFGVGTAAIRMVWERNRPRPVSLEDPVDPSACRLPAAAVATGTLDPRVIRSE